MRRLDSKAHTDYSIGPNAVERRRQRTSIDRVRCKIGKIHGMFCIAASVDRKIVSQGIPYTDHRRAWSAMDTMCMLMDRLLFGINTTTSGK